MKPANLNFVVAAFAVSTASVTAQAETVRFTIDAARNVHAISRYVYGYNGVIGNAAFPNLTLRRMGGNRWTAYNWENNASNAGSDFIFQNDDYLGGGDTPGGAVMPAIANAKNQNAALLLTVPIQGYVAADKKGDGDVHKTPNYLQVRFKQEKPAKGTAFTLTPKLNDAYVYQDEFVNWVKTKYPYSQLRNSIRPIWFSMDNEPDLWSDTHAEVHPKPVTYAEMITRTTAYADAVKAVAPNTLIFGPVSYGFAGYVRLQDAPDANDRDFLSFFLAKMKAAQTTHHKRLLDVLDLHWYPEAVGNGVRITESSTNPAVVAARLQAPRSLWDPTYKEDSWIANDWYNGPINLLPGLKNKIARYYPGTKLAFTEYNYGAGQHISGGIAQADVLGIFGRDGVFAATQFPLRAREPFVQGAFQMYRAFDGGTASFGDKSIYAVTNNKVDSSVYASLDSTNAKRLVIIAINKTAAAINANIVLNNAPTLHTAHIYTLTDASPAPQSQGKKTVAASFPYVMPAYSVSTIELTP